ncbi:MAG: glycosyltransferase [Candidatus Caldarchaeum sp.]
MEKPRVLFQVITSLVPGGAERLVVNLLRYHDRSKYQPVCICLGNPVGSHYEAIVRNLEIPLYFLGKGDKADWGVYKKLERLFAEYRPTVVHTHLLGLNYAYLAMLKHRTPVRVHTLHSLAHKEIGNRVARIVRNLAFRYRIGGVIPVAIAEEVARTIGQVYGYKNPPVIPNGIPTEEYVPNPEKRAQFRAAHGVEPEAVVIVHVGRFVELKNHALLLQAFAQLKSTHPLYLWLVGDGELRPAMEQRARELGIAERVRFWGVRSDVADILNAADIFTLPSKYEGNPMSVMEAMAAGLPVVASHVGGIPELVEDEHQGLLVPADDQPCLVQGLQALIDNPTKRYQLGKSAVERARKKFDIHQTVQAYEKLYEMELGV